MNLDELQSARDRERQTDKPQQLRESFYADVGEFVEQLRAERDRVAERNDDPYAPEAMRLKDELDAARQLVEDIHERRIGKVVKAASLEAADLSTEVKGLTTEERELFAALVGDIERHREHVLEVVDGASPDRGGVEHDETVDPTGGVSAADVMGDGVDAGTGSGSEPTSQTEQNDTGAPSALENGSTPDSRSADAGEEAVPPDRSDRDDDSPDNAGGAGDPRTGSSGDGAVSPGDRRADGTQAEPVDRTRTGPASGESTPPAGGGSPGPTDGTPPEVGSEPAPSRTQAAEESTGAPARSDGAGVSSTRSDGAGVSSTRSNGTDGVGTRQGSTGRIERERVLVTEDIDTFVGFDDRDYDLAAGDVVTLPETNAELLVERDAARRL